MSDWDIVISLTDNIYNKPKVTVEATLLQIIVNLHYVNKHKD